MKQRLKTLITQAARKAFEAGAFKSDAFADVELEETKAAAHGDFATNFAMLSAKQQKMAPRKIAQILVDHLEKPEDFIENVEIAGPGFINFFLCKGAWPPVVADILEQDRGYGQVNAGKGRRIQVEFVSANPTGPLHVGHGRGAAVGDSVANILAFAGYAVQREYYINDSGRQIRTLGRSVFLRCKQALDESCVFPEDCYQGDYIRQLALQVIQDKGVDFIRRDEDEAVAYCARFAADAIITGIREDLKNFGVVFDQWYSEQSLFDSGKLEQVIEDLKSRGIIYSHEGAWWFKTCDFGDEKDRVVVRANGLTTYFASDIAYHRDKYLRGMDKVIDVWGADHHGYIPRMTAAVQATGQDREQFDVILVQLVNLLRGGQPVAMSTRAGEFETLKDVVDEVGSDAARFIFLTRDYGSPLDFDLETAKKKSNDNPVYYVQYVHARISSIQSKASGLGLGQARWEPDMGGHLVEAEEIDLMKALSRYPEVIESAAEALAPHRITYYLMNLASLFHTYYNKHRVLCQDVALSSSRLCLVTSVQKVIRNGLTLLGVSAPEKM